MSTKFYAGQLDYIYQLNLQDDNYVAAIGTVTGKANKAGDTFTGALTLSWSTPAIIFNDTDQGVDLKRMWLVSDAGKLQLQTRTDADVFVATPFSVDRSGNGVFAGTLNVTGTITSPTFAGTATNAINASITNDTTTNSTFYPAFMAVTSGNGIIRISNTKFTFNPSTGVLTTTALATSGISVFTANRSLIGDTTGAGWWQFGQSATNNFNWHAGSAGDGSMRFMNGAYNSGTERMRLTQNGSLLISTQTDDGVSKLQVAGNANIAGTIISSGAGLSAYPSSGGNVIGLRFANIAATTNLQYKLATLPISTSSTTEHLVLEGVLDTGWTSSSKTTFKILVGNRNGLTVQYEKGAPRQSYIEIYTEADGSVSVWGCMTSGAFTNLSVNMYGMGGTTTNQLIMIANPVAGVPTGTLSFSTATGVPAMQLTAGNRVLIATNTDDGTTKLQVGGNTSINGNLVLGGNLTVNGTTTTANSTTVTIADPIFTLGGTTAPTVDDGKDRGIEFRWYNGVAKTGFFGFDRSTGFFTFIPDGTNTGEVYAGALGTIQANLSGNVTGNVTGALTGNADTATKLATARAINGVNFDGTGAITITANTTNTIAFNNGGAGAASGTTFNGSAAIIISYNTIGAAGTGADNTLTGVNTFSGTFVSSGTSSSLGTNTGASTVNVGTGATVNAATKTINVGTSGVAGSTTNITFGPTLGTVTYTFNGASGVKLPVGTTANRPTAAQGLIRFNTDTTQFEGYNGASWTSVGGGAKGGGADQVFYENDQTVNSSYTITTGKNAVTVGPLTIASAATVTVPTGSRLVIL